MDNKTGYKEFFIPYKNKSIKYIFNTFSGEVINTSERSDANISSATSVRNSKVSSRTHISTTVNRDVWLIDKNGHEKHFRFKQDVPVRSGQTLHVVSLSGDFIENNTMQYAVYNSNTKEYSLLFDDNENKLTQFLNTPGFSHITAGWWLISIIGLFFWIVPGVILLIMGDGFSARKEAIPIFSRFNQEFNTLKQELELEYPLKN